MVNDVNDALHFVVVCIAIAIITLSVIKLDGWPMWLNIMLAILVTISSEPSD